jgi:hypothetical protein
LARRPRGNPAGSHQDQPVRRGDGSEGYRSNRIDWSGQQRKFVGERAKYCIADERVEVKHHRPPDDLVIGEQPAKKDHHRQPGNELPLQSLTDQPKHQRYDYGQHHDRNHLGCHDVGWRPSESWLRVEVAYEFGIGFSRPEMVNPDRSASVLCQRNDGNQGHPNERPDHTGNPSEGR